MAGIKLNSILIAILFLLSGCAKPKYVESSINKASDTTSDKADLCQLDFKKLNACASIKWETLPTQKDSGSFILQFYSNGADFALTRAPRVFLWMPSMGHGSSPVTVKVISSSAFNVEKVFFIMPGEWDINVLIQNENGASIDQASYSLII